MFKFENKIFLSLFQTILLLYEYTINVDSNRNQKSKKPYWHDILNDSSTFEDNIQKANINLDPTSLKLLPMILKALNHNLVFDNESADSNPKPVSENNVDGYSQTEKNTFSNWQRTPNTIDYRPHYKSPANLDYYSKIRKIRNYQKVISLFDKMMNNKMSITSSEVTVEELTDKPKVSKESKENDKKRNTYLTRRYSSTPRSIIIRKVTQPKTNKKLTPTATTPPKINNTRNKQCLCPKKLRTLLSKVLHSMQDVLPELTLLLKVPCNSSASATRTPTVASTDSTISTSPGSTSASSEVSPTSLENDDVTPTRSITLPFTLKPLITIYPNTLHKSYVTSKKAKKHLEIKPQSNMYLELPMQKLNVRSIMKKKFNSETRKNFHKSSTENKNKYIDAPEVAALSKLLTTPMTKVLTSIATTTISSIPTITTTAATTAATNAATIAATTSATTTEIKINQIIGVPSTVYTTADMEITPDDDDEYLFPIVEEDNTNFNSSSIPQELFEYNPQILELIKSNILRSRPKFKKFAAKEPNTYLDQFMENTSILQENMNKENKKELHKSTLEQLLPTMVDHGKLENKIKRTKQLIMDLKNINNTYRQILNAQENISLTTERLNSKDKLFKGSPLIDENLVKSINKKNTQNNISPNFQETFNRDYLSVQALEPPKSDQYLKKSTLSVTKNIKQAEMDSKLFKKTKTQATNILQKENANNNMMQEPLSHERFSRKEGMLKGKYLELHKSLVRMASNNDRKSSRLSKSKGETDKEANNYMSWLENVGHPVNVMSSTWLASLASSINTPKTINFESSWNNKKNDFNKNSYIETKNNNLNIQNNNHMEPFTATTWSYVLFNEDNKTPNCSKKETDNGEIEMPDSENLQPVQEIPLSSFFGNTFIPETFKKKKQISYDDQLSSVDNTQSFSKSMLPHNRPIYLEIARRDWKKDIKEDTKEDSSGIDYSKESDSDVY